MNECSIKVDFLKQISLWLKVNTHSPKSRSASLVFASQANLTLSLKLKPVIFGSLSTQSNLFTKKPETTKSSLKIN
jgi:hypothetical protein